MEDYIIRKNKKIFTIGDYNISMYKNKGIRFEIPFSGMAFYQPRKINENIDFELVLDEVDTDLESNVLWGSLDFRIPTFVSQLENGEYEWKTRTYNDEPALSYRINESWDNFILYEDETNTNGEYAFIEFGKIFSVAVLNRCAAVFHGVVMEYEGHGILVMAKSGVGKTTHTRMWRDTENALILNGDRCLVRCLDGVWYGYGMPWAGSSGEYINRRVTIDAIVALDRDSYNHAETLSEFDATIYLMQRIFAPAWTCEMQSKGFDVCEELALKIPVVRMYCTAEVEAVQVLKSYLQEIWQ